MGEIEMCKCKELRQDNTCKLKDDVKKQHCTINPTGCCAMCDNEINNTCNAKKGICIKLF